MEFRLNTCWAMIAVLVFGAAFPASSARAYTIASTSGGVPLRWSAQEVEYRVDDATFDDSLPASQAYAALAMAFDAWRGFPGVPDLRLAQGAPRAVGHHGGNASNGIYRVADWPYAREQLAVTVVTYDTRTGRILDADILINGEVTFAMLDESGPTRWDAFDLPAILAHEAGHALGLGESEDDPEATMWPYARPGDTHQRTLAEDDENAVIEAYRGAAPGLSQGCGQASVLGAPEGLTSTGAVLLLPVLALAAVRRRGFGMGVALLALGAALGSALLPTAPEYAEFEPGAPGSAEQGVRKPGVDHAPRQAGPEAPHLLLHPAPPHAHPAPASDGRSPARGEEPSHARLPNTGTPHSRQAAESRLAQLLRHYPEVHIGVATRGEVDQSTPLWFTNYRVRTPGGEEVTVRLPGGTDGRLVQRVGELTLPEDGRDLLVAEDSRGRAVWTYLEDGIAFGGALGQGKAPLPL